MKNFALLILLVFSSSGVLSKESPRYIDAVNVERAYGQLFQFIITNEFLAETCTNDFPELASDIATNYETWKKNEASVIEKTNKFITEIGNSGPLNADGMRKLILSAIANSHKQVKDQPEEIYRAYCSNRFTDLAKGAWRHRTPNTYKFIDQAK